ncbi:MAG: dipicolinate synthase subunit B [Clostridia bacterium]|nr:dipicolinate synthase subunit B [Clostridia bacterium]
MDKITLGFAITGSFCTFSTVLKEMENLVNLGYKIIPIFSYNAANLDTRFFKASDFRNEVKRITNNEPVDTIQGAETLGPNNLIDIMVVAPCTGNTLSKIALAITDTPVTMAVKAHLRNNKPVVIAVSTNDALGLNLKNIGTLITTKNIYFVPFEQDNFSKKPNSLISNYSLIGKTIEKVKEGVQLQPVIYQKGVDNESI